MTTSTTIEDDLKANTRLRTELALQFRDITFCWCMVTAEDPEVMRSSDNLYTTIRQLVDQLDLPWKYQPMAGPTLSKHTKDVDAVRRHFNADLQKLCKYVTSGFVPEAYHLSREIMLYLKYFLYDK